MYPIVLRARAFRFADINGRLYKVLEDDIYGFSDKSEGDDKTYMMKIRTYNNNAENIRLEKETYYSFLKIIQDKRND